MNPPAPVTTITSTLAIGFVSAMLSFAPAPSHFTQFLESDRVLLQLRPVLAYMHVNQQSVPERMKGMVDKSVPANGEPEAQEISVDEIQHGPNVERQPIP